MSPAAKQHHESPETALDRDAADLQTAVADLVRVYQFRDRDRICCHDISVTQCYALETLVEHGPLRLSALADRLFLDKSTTSRVVGTLVKKGYVEQSADAQDGRAIALNATRKGRSLCARITGDLVGQQNVITESRSDFCFTHRRTGQTAARASGELTLRDLRRLVRFEMRPEAA